MSFKIITSFGVAVGVYLLGLGVFTLIKYIINRKKVNKEMEVIENEEKKSIDDSNIKE